MGDKNRCEECKEIMEEKNVRVVNNNQTVKQFYCLKCEKLFPYSEE